MFIPEPHKAQSHVLEHPIASGIACLLLGPPVYPSIHFDHQAGCVTIEIHYETGDDLLAPEMRAEPVAAQLPPEHRFRGSHLAAQLPGALKLLPGDLLTCNDLGCWHSRILPADPRPGLPLKGEAMNSPSHLGRGQGVR